jgi:hypothetical protein
MAMAKVFHAAGESWTLSSEYFDVTNYALFSGDDQAARLIVDRVSENARRLNANMIVSAECGHGFGSLRWEGENWLGCSYGLPVTSAVEVMAEPAPDPVVPAAE